jgi:hypothetical protein
MSFFDKAKLAAELAAARVKKGVEDVQQKRELSQAYNELGKTAFELLPIPTSRRRCRRRQRRRRGCPGVAGSQASRCGRVDTHRAVWARRRLPSARRSGDVQQPVRAGRSSGTPVRSTNSRAKAANRSTSAWSEGSPSDALTAPPEGRPIART